MELLQYWKIIRKRLWLIALLAIVAGTAAFYFARQEVPVYKTSTTLFLNPVSASPLLPYQTTASAQSLANTYTEFMRTRSFAALVVESLPFPLKEGEVLGAISAKSLPDTQFFKIEATHPDPQVAQALANTAAQVLIAENTNRQRAQREQLEAQRDPARLAQLQRLTEMEKTLQDEIAYAEDRIASLQAEIATLEARPPSEETDQHILDLRGELLAEQTQRVDLFGSLAQTQAALASIGETSNTVVDTAVVVDPATLPLAPQPLNLLQNVLLAVAAGMGLGVGLAFLLEYIDYTIKTPEELDAVYGMPTLGVIGAFQAGNSRAGNGKGGNPGDLVTLHHPRSPITEAFRALRTNIQFSSPGKPIRSLLVTSAGPMEGKTSISANLALILAQGGKRVILVDADLRRPRVHRLFGVPTEPGFTDLIVDLENGVEAYLQATDEPNLRLLTCGPLPRNPAELLGSARAAEVMEQVEAAADVVVYDTPPAATVTDAVVLASRVDAALQVVQAGGTRRELVLRAKTSLEKVGARLLGPVLNQVNAADMGYYTYYYYHGYYQEGHEPGKRQGLLGRLRGRGRAGSAPRPED